MTALLAATAPAAAEGIAGQFDLYVLSLAWSERACAADEDDFDEVLCAAGKNGFDFVSLAPRHETGAPTSCPTLMPTALSDDRLLAVDDLLPKSAALDEWATRGVCTGLRPEAYFELARQAVARVTIPPSLTRPGVPDRLTPEQIADDFAAVNAGMPVEGLSVDCYRGVFAGIRICLTKELAFRPCEQVHAARCRGESLAIPEIE